jgi:dystonin
MPDYHQPNDHEWFCPVAIEVMAAMAADRPKSRSQSSLSRKSSSSSTRKSSAPPSQTNISKGRTNVELREQFTLASGVSQSMTPFKSKPRGDRGESPTSSVSGDTRNGAQGPITKIKEKSERSLGMNVRSSVDYGYDSYDRRTSTQGRNSLTPGSRPGSRPPSRHGSNMSLNSEDDGSRSGVRRTSSMRSGSRTLRPSPMGFGSGVPRKTSTPGGRERTDSASSQDRTPFSAR